MHRYLILGLAVAILSVIFALQNPSPVTVRLFVWEFGSSLALVLLAAFGLGILTSLLISIPTVIRRKMKIGELERQVLETKAPDAPASDP